MSRFKKYFAAVKGMFGKLGASPSHDWYFALLCFVASVALAVAIDAFLFLRLSASGEESAAGTDLSSLTIKSKDISDAVDALVKGDADSSTVPEIVRTEPAN